METKNFKCLCLGFLPCVSVVDEAMSHCESLCYIRAADINCLCLCQEAHCHGDCYSRNRTQLSCPVFGKSHKLMTCYCWETLLFLLAGWGKRRLKHIVTQLRHPSQVPPSRPLSSWELDFRALPPWLSSTKADRNSTSSSRTPLSRPRPCAATPRSSAVRQTSAPRPQSSSAPHPARLNGCRSHRCPPSLAPQLRWFNIFTEYWTQLLKYL